MIPYIRQLNCAKRRLGSLQLEKARTAGTALERLNKEIEEQSAIVATVEKVKMLAEVSEEMKAERNLA